jgi:hypothetical protein
LWTTWACWKHICIYSYSYIQVAQYIIVLSLHILLSLYPYAHTHTLRSLIPIIRFEVVLYISFSFNNRKKKDDEVGNMRRLLEANNYSIYVPSISLIIWLFMNGSQENNRNIWTFKMMIMSFKEEAIWSLITSDNDDSWSKWPMPMNCSYPACFLFFNHLHLHFFVIITLMTIKQKKRRRRRNWMNVIMSYCWFQLQYPVVCAYHTMLFTSLILLHFRSKCSLCLSRCISSFMSLLIKQFCV